MMGSHGTLAHWRTAGALVLAIVGLAAGLDLAIRAQSHSAGMFPEVWGRDYVSQVTADEIEARTQQTVDTERSGAVHMASEAQTETQAQSSSSLTLTRVRVWNVLATSAVAIDHTPPSPGENRVFGEHFGPARTARALAIVHVALFEAANAVGGAYRSYLGIPRDSGASIDAAIAQAAHDALVGTYRSQQPLFDAALAIDLALIPNGSAKTRGLQLGRQAAAAILALRANDGAQHTEPRIGIEYIPPVGLGFWSQDPVSLIPLALGAFWSQVDPFVMNSANQFRLPPPPALSSAAYATAFEEVNRLGGCGTDPAGCVGGFPTPTTRTADQTVAGIYWGYDGTPGLGTPPRFFNQIALVIAARRGSNAIQLARLLALINVGMADAALGAWESKYFHIHWRPVVAIRRANEDGNPATPQNATYTPLGSPATNLIGPNFTPPFPAYGSGHSTFGSAVFQIMRRFYGTDAIPFTMISDEFNGLNRDNQGNRRPFRPRSFSTLTQAELENGQSRIYLGVHWQYDNTQARVQGRQIGDFVFANVFRPR